MLRGRKRCLSCDAVLEADGTCFFCDPKPDHRLRPQADPQQRIDRIGTMLLLCVCIVMVFVVGHATGNKFIDTTIAIVKKVAGIGGAASDSGQPTDWRGAIGAPPNDTKPSSQ